MLLVGLYDNFPNSHGKVTFPPTPHHVNENKVNQENDTFMRNNNPSKKKTLKLITNTGMSYSQEHISRNNVTGLETNTPSEAKWESYTSANGCR